MATEIKSRRFYRPDSALASMKAKKLMVSYVLNTDGDIIEKPITELFYRDAKGNFKKFSSLSEFKQKLTERVMVGTEERCNVFYDNTVATAAFNLNESGEGAKFKTHILEDSGEVQYVYYIETGLPQNYETTENVTTVMYSGATSNYGLKKSVGIKENKTINHNADNYLMLTLDGSSKVEFYKKSEIYFFDGSTMKPIFDVVHGLMLDITLWHDKQLFVHNKKVTSLYFDADYSFDGVKSFESLDEKNNVKHTYDLVEKELSAEEKAEIDMRIAEHEAVVAELGPDADLSEVDREKAEKYKDNKYIKEGDLYYEHTDFEKGDDYFSELSPVTLTVAVTDVKTKKEKGKTKVVEKTKEEPFYAAKSYNADENGEYILVRVRSHDKDEMIKITDLYNEDHRQLVDKSELKSYIGKTLKVKVGDKFEDLERLTYEQATIYFSKVYNYEKSVSSDDVLKDNAYLQTANGEFISESTVKPYTYKFIDDELAADAFLVRVKDGTSFVEYIVSKDKYAEATAGLDVEKRFPVKATNFENADIIQTTSSGEIKESCKVIGSYNTETSEYRLFEGEDRETFVAGQMESFENVYKQGLYDVSHVYVGEDKVELDKRKQRYVYTDTHYMEDYAGKTNEMRARVNGKFKFGKAMKNDMLDWGKHYISALGMMAGMGLFGVVMAPVLGVIALEGPFKLIKNTVLLVKDKLNFPIQDKIEENRKQWSKDIDTQLAKVQQEVLGTEYEKGISKDAFLSRIQSLRMEVLAMAKCTCGEGFKLENGKIIATDESINDARKFKKNHKKELKVLKALEKERDKALARTASLYEPFQKLLDQGKPINTESKKYKEYLAAKEISDRLSREYADEEANFNGKLNSARGKAAAYGKDKKLEFNLNRIENLENISILQKFTSKEELLDFGLTEEEIKTLETIKFDVHKNLFVVKGEEFNADTCMPALKLYTEMISGGEVTPENAETVALLKKLKAITKKEEFLAKKKIVPLDRRAAMEEEHEREREHDREDEREREREEEHEHDREDEHDREEEHDDDPEHERERRGDVPVERIAELEEKVRALEEENGRLTSAKEESERKIRELEEKLGKSITEEERNELLEKLQAAKQEYEELSNEYQKKLLELQAKERELQNRERELEEARKQIERMMGIQEENAKLQEKLKRLEREKAETEERLKGQLTEKDSKIAELQEKLSELTKKIEDINIEMAALKTERDALKSENASLKEQNEINKEQIARLLEIKKYLESEHKRLSDDLANEKDLNAQNQEAIKKLEENLRECESQLEELYKENAELKEQAKVLKQENEALKKELDEYKADLIRLGNEKAELEEKFRSLLNEKDEEISNLYNQLQQFNEQILELKLIIAGNETELEYLRNHNEELESSNQKLKDKNKELKSKLDEANKAKERLQNLLAEAIKRIEDKKSRIANLDAEINSLKEEIDSISQKIKDKRQQYIDLKNKISLTANASNAEKEALNKELAAYRKELREITSDLNKVRTQLNECESSAIEIMEWWQDGLTEDGKEVDESNKARVQNVKDLIAQTLDYEKEVEDLNLDNLKIDKEYDTKINSEKKLLELLESNDQELFDYLKSCGLKFTDADIQATIKRIKSRHANSGVATSNLTKLKNQMVAEILIKGQTYVTKDATNDFTI